MHRLTKRFGQHILKDEKYLKRIVESCDFSLIPLVIEIGPGPGNLTELLLKKAEKLVAIEIDKRFCAQLKTKFGQYPNFILIEKDALKSGKLADPILEHIQSVGKGRWALVSNLPYNIASTVIIEALYNEKPPLYLTVTIQKEVAERIIAQASTKEYSPISVLTQAVADPKIVSHIPRGAFLPPPKVTSSIVKITYNEEKEKKIPDKSYFRRFITRLFIHRRKTIYSGFIKRLPDNEREKLDRIITQLNISAEQRPEELTVEELIKLTSAAYKKGIKIPL